jgi:ATP-dependent Clp protease protease subunit
MNPIYTMPHILIETSEGTTAHSLQDELFQDRQIELVGEVTSESAYAIMLQLRYLQKAGPAAPITLYINSPGGEVSSGLALYDVMQAVKCPVRTVCLGTAASMAAILFAGGDKRGILPHGKVMIHDPLTTGVGGSALTIDSLSRNLMQTRQITAGILARHTGRSLDGIYACTAKDTYFNAQEAIDFGLADFIMEEM